MKKIPYGISDYKRIKEKGYYFIDKTHFIPEIETGGTYQMFLRPRRFGKSLLIAVLEAYYSIDYRDDFELLFGDTYIGKHKTEEAGSYYVLRLDFSAVDIKDVEESFSYSLDVTLKSFIKRHKIDVNLTSKNPINTLIGILNYFADDKDKSLFILVDEYDNFANKLLVSNKDEYLRIVTDKTAFFKQFFTVLKSGTTGNDAPIKRMFITGVTPMTMYDVTSGFNIGENISLKNTFNELIGVTKKERDELFEYYNIPQKYISLVDEWYNNYVFSVRTEESIYNTDMILYFIKNYLQNDDIPDELIDINVRSDYAKLRHLIYTNEKINGNFELLQKLIAGEDIAIPSISQDFSGVNLSERYNFVSLFYYLGLLTIKGSGLDVILHIPNETVKRIDIDYVKSALYEYNVFRTTPNVLVDTLRNFATKGDIEVFRTFANEIKQNTSIRDYMTAEVIIKAMYITYLSMTNYYVIKSEAELNKGFADLFLVPLNPYVEYFGIVEIKYIARSEKPSREFIDAKLQEAKGQLAQYEQDALVNNIIAQGKKLVKVAMVFYGWEMLICEDVK